MRRVPLRPLVASPAAIAKIRSRIPLRNAVAHRSPFQAALARIAKQWGIAVVVGVATVCSLAVSTATPFLILLGTVTAAVLSRRNLQRRIQWWRCALAALVGLVVIYLAFVSTGRPPPMVGTTSQDRVLKAIFDVLGFAARILGIGAVILAISYETSKAMVHLIRRIVFRLTLQLATRKPSPAAMSRQARWTISVPFLCYGYIGILTLSSIPPNVISEAAKPIPLWGQFFVAFVLVAILGWGVAWGARDGSRAPLRVVSARPKALPIQANESPSMKRTPAGRPGIAPMLTRKP